MTVRMHAVTAAIAAVAAALVLAGCGSESRDPDAPAATVGTTGAPVEVGNTINYGSFGTTANIDCADGKSVNIGGSNNTLTVTGTCANVNIGGADNKVTFERIDKEIAVVGLNNTVTYKDGDPKINDTGNNNKITKG
jgi:hypothetical protein